jgi:hypothetical protein
MKLRDVKVLGFPGPIRNENVLVCMKAEKSVSHAIDIAL